MSIRYHASPVSSHDLLLCRRGIEYGWVRESARPAMPDAPAVESAWERHEAVLLPGLLADVLERYAPHIAQAHRLYQQTLAGETVADLLESEPYAGRLSDDFDLSGSSFEDNDDQGIEKVYFDAWQDDDIVADDLWCKASWLSFDDEDGSLRFRFSFGMEGYEDVAADPERQAWAAKLTDAVFPESAAITEHPGLRTVLESMLGSSAIGFMERIVYFNAPNGGAQMHHDVERGHDGVVFAQLSGSTFWLALGKPVLMDEIDAYLAQAPADQWSELRALGSDRAGLSRYLDEQDHELAEALIDRHPDFFRHLIERGYAYILQPGDVLLMRQNDLDTCVWHSVICLGEEAGEGLSFALKVGRA